MDSPSLFKTGHTIDQTQLYRPSNQLDTSGLSNRLLYGSDVHSPRVQLSNLHFETPIPRQMQSINMQRIPIQPQYIQMRQPIPVQQPNANQVSVYCPVCRRGYTNQDAEVHAMAHDATRSYNFQTIDRRANNNTNLIKKTDQTHDSVSTLGSSRASTSLVQYPLIQPMQFWTNQLSDSAKEDIFIIKDRQNYDKVQKDLFKPILQLTKPTYVSSQAQTFSKPPLQYQSNNTNLYNCLDNAVNANNGPKFSFTDLFTNNQCITPKRQLDQWQTMTRNQNQLRAPRIN